MSISFLGAQKAESGVIASSRPVQPIGGAANVKGSYLPLITATAGPTAWVLVDVNRPNGATDYLIDIAVGAGGVEQVIIPNLPIAQNLTGSPAAASWLFPLFIPAGSRIAAREQNALGGGTADVQVTCFAPMFGGELGLGKVEACGAITGTSLGTSVDPGGTINTKGTTPTQLIAATSFAYKWGCLSITHTNAVGSGTSWTVDLMVGGAGSEVVVVPDLAVFASSVADTNPAIGMCFPLSIPDGTRISARCQCSVNTASERLLELVLHGCG